MSNKRIGLIVLTEISQTGLVAVLRERSELCRITIHGKIEVDDSNFLAGLFRELIEELGCEFAVDITEMIKKNSAPFKNVFRNRRGDKDTAIFAIVVAPLLLEKIRLVPKSGSLRLISPNEADQIVDTGNRVSKAIVMFPDEKQALIAAFKWAQ
jgi:8-oxo-dGTP pyrophosphatase MutT (NUDIX family)